MSQEDQRKAAMAQIRGVYEDGEAEINGRVYKLHKMTHVDRRKVFAFYTSVQHQANAQNFSFLDTPQFAAVEDVMWKSVSFDGATLNKLRDHWEEYPEDYIQLVTVTMGVMSFPFIRAAATVSASLDEGRQTNTLSKPM